jgi:hypothetical protein
MKKTVKGYAMISKHGVFIKTIPFEPGWCCFMPTYKDATRMMQHQRSVYRIVPATMTVELEEGKK